MTNIINTIKIIPCTLFLSLSSINYCQEQPNSGYQISLDRVVPPSPNSVELGKYGSFPVSYYTGLPNISIPLFDLNTGSIKVPINLQYHASGIRVDDISSWVGLGWSLNAGGVITVSPMGESDFPFVGPGEEAPPRDTPMTYTDITTDNLTFSLSTLHRLHTESTAEPDLYNYHFCNYSGQFALDHMNSIHFLNNSSGLTITFAENDKSFLIVDNLGNRYLFDILEYTTVQGIRYGLRNVGGITSFLTNGISDYGENSISSFYLSKIISSNNTDTIYFEYETDNQEYFTRISGFIENKNYSNCREEVMYHNCRANELNNEYNNIQVSEWDLQPESENFSSNYVIISSKRLKRIINRKTNTIIIFNEDSRLDIKGSKRLSSIDITCNGDVFTWNFDNDKYFESNIARIEQAFEGYVTNNPLHKRLKLEGIYKSGTNVDTIPYTFAYYGDDDPNLKLPPRNCYAGVDSWGFCNGNPSFDDTNNPLKSFPSHQIALYESNPFLQARNGVGFQVFNNAILPIFTSGGNKQPNENYVMANSLKKITYPTKGFTLFEYEINRFNQIVNSTVSENTICSGIRIKRITESGLCIENSVIKEFSYSGGVVFNIPDYGNQGFIKNRGEYIPNYKIFNNCISSLTSYGNLIGYNQVTEASMDGTVIYTYYTINDEPVYDSKFACARVDQMNIPLSMNYPHIATKFISDTRYPRLRQFDSGAFGKNYRSGLNKETAYFNSTGNLVKKIKYTYDFIDKEAVFGNKVYEKLWFDAFLASTPEFYILYIYHHQSGKSFLIGKEITDYDINGSSPIISNQHYSYDVDKELIKSSEETINSNTIKTTLTYPFDYPDLTYEESNGNRTPIHSVLHKMVQKNMLAYPVEELKLVNGKWVDGKLTIYGEFGSFLLPKSIYSFNLGATQTSSLAFDGRIINTNYFNKVSVYDSYDIYGNIIQYHKNKDKSTSFIWGYNNTYPIAAVENAEQNEISYTSFETYADMGGWVWSGQIANGTTPKTGRKYFQLSGTNSLKILKPAGQYRLEYWAKGPVSISGGTVTPVSESQPSMNGWMHVLKNITLSTESLIALHGTTYIDELRLYPADAQMTTYTYDPLVGMTSQTDANGITTYYEYDGFGRLKCIKDNDGNILKEHEYHYANQ